MPVLAVIAVMTTTVGVRADDHQESADGPSIVGLIPEEIVDSFDGPSLIGYVPDEIVVSFKASFFNRLDRWKRLSKNKADAALDVLGARQGITRIS